MKPIFEFFDEVLNCRLSQIFFAANLAIGAAWFDWEKCFAYLKWLDKIGCKPKPKGVSFGLYDISGGAENATIALCLAMCALFLAILALPSIVITSIILSFLRENFPALCDETFDLIYVPILVVVNGFCWILLGWLIERRYSETIQNRPARENPLSIFSG